MTARERFRRQMRFERVDHSVRWESWGFWGQTIARWRKEGLPEGASPEEYFGLDPRVYLEVASGMTALPYDPAFEQVVIERTEKHVVYRNAQGILMRERADHAGLSMPQWLDFPVKTRADWEKMRDERLDPDTPTRYPDWAAIHRKWDERACPLGLSIVGAYGTPRNLFGEERLALVYYDDPDFVHEIMKWWVWFYKRLISNVTANLPGIDYVFLWEDMAYKTGPLISPAFVKRFMIPYYEELIDHIYACDIPTVLLDTDGNAEALLDLFLEAGIRALIPLEVAADMEPTKIRKRYGRRLALAGGIDKRAVAEGGEAMRREVMRKVPDLLKDGGYIPAEDHSTPPDTPFENFRAFVELLRELGDKYGA